MPTSHFYQLNEIIELIYFSRPKSILDIGVGFGKFGLLAREYLDIWGRGNHDYLDWETKIEGIEIFKEYLTPVHEFLYDKIYIGDVLEVLPKLKEKYDLILFIDVLEHLDYEDGIKILSLCKSISKNTIISTPQDIGNQKGSRGNIYEAHKFQWRSEHFDIFPEKFFIPNKKSLLCFAGKDSELIKKRIKDSQSYKRNFQKKNKSIKDNMKKRFPRALKLYRKLK